MTQGVKGTGPHTAFNPDGTKKPSKKPSKQAKSGRANGISHAEARHVSVLRTGRNLYLITITGVGAFIAKKARILVS